MSVSLNFGLNHIVAPRLDFRQFADLAVSLGITDVEIRNDLPGVPMQDGTPPGTIRSVAEAAGLTILTINALYPFDVWDDERAVAATKLADYAQACGARALVLCPLNSRDDKRDEQARKSDLISALAGLRPILATRGLTGLIEALGFEESALRLKRNAIVAIAAIGAGECFALLHDTFHHYLAGEKEIFAGRTGLVHISGVENLAVPLKEIRDGQRGLVGRTDALGTVAQIRDLVAAGYRGPFSFEPFAEEVHELADIAGALRDSIAFIRRSVEN